MPGLVEAPPGLADADAEGLPLFCQQRLLDFPRQMALGHQLFQPGMLTRQRPQPHRFRHLKRPLPAAPAVNRLRGKAILSAHRADLLPGNLRFTPYPDHRLFWKPWLGHRIISWGTLPRCLTLDMVRNLGSWSGPE